MKNKLWTIAVILVVIALAVVPLVLRPDAEFGGADDQAKGAIAEIAPDYQPWFSSILEPKSGEVASLLFSLQAGIGGLIVGYALAYFKYGRKNRNQNDVPKKENA